MKLQELIDKLDNALSKAINENNSEVYNKLAEILSKL